LMFARMRSRIEAAAPFPRIGVVRIAGALGNRADMNIAVSKCASTVGCVRIGGG
jgi:hypothetical protein